MRNLLLLVLASAAFAQTPPVRFQRVVTGLTSPVAIEFSPDGSGRMFVIEQVGRIRLVKNGKLVERPFLDWRSRVSCCGERGLLGMAFPPGFEQKRYFYINYTDPQGNTAVSRVRVSVDPDLASAETEEVILRIAQPFSNHNGGGLVFGPKDGYLYIGTGDGGSGGDPQGNGQNRLALLGKMLRIDVESGGRPYAIPPDNPFVGNSAYRPEIWAGGLRNPWRYSFDRQTSDLWIADVGQARAEEVNFQPASSKGGENYGWNRMEGLQCYPATAACNQEGLVKPVLEYGRSQGVSVTGGFVYRGTRWTGLQGRYLYGDFGSGTVWAFDPVTSTSPVLTATAFNIAAFGQDTNGELYLADYDRGAIHTIVVGPPLTTTAAIVNAASFGPGLVPGSIATAFGVGITSLPGIVGAEQLPLPADLNGTSVTLNGIRAPLFAIAAGDGQEQINFQVPWELAGSSTAALVITANGQTGSPVQVPIVPSQPEIFAAVRSGNALTIYATGLGPVLTPPTTGQAVTAAVPLIATAEVTVGGISVPVTFAGLPTRFVGLYQVNATVPASVLGDVVLRVGSAISRPFKLL